MILDLLAVEAEIDVRPVILRQSDAGGNGKRDALIRGADQRLRVNAVRMIARRVIFAEAGDLAARPVLARIDKIGRLPAALQRKIAEAQHVVFYHEPDEFFLVRHIVSP